MKDDNTREELRADDETILHASALDVQKAIVEADRDETFSDSAKKVLAGGPLPGTTKREASHTRTLSLGSMDKKVTTSKGRLLMSFDSSKQHESSVSLRQAH